VSYDEAMAELTPQRTGACPICGWETWDGECDQCLRTMYDGIAADIGAPPDWKEQAQRLGYRIEHPGHEGQSDG
jgi:hypothetical protein